MNRIDLCHLDSLTCLPALSLVFAELGDRSGLVLSSRRFELKHGGYSREACTGNSERDKRDNPKQARINSRRKEHSKRACCVRL